MILYVPTVRVKNEVAESRASGQEVSPLVQPSHQYSRKTTARCHRVVEGFIVIIINTFRPLEHCTRCIHEYNIIINVYMHEHLAAVTYIYTGKVSTTQVQLQYAVQRPAQENKSHQISRQLTDRVPRIIPTHIILYRCVYTTTRLAVVYKNNHNTVCGEISGINLSANAETSVGIVIIIIQAVEFL